MWTKEFAQGDGITIRRSNECGSLFGLISLVENLHVYLSCARRLGRDKGKCRMVKIHKFEVDGQGCQGGVINITKFADVRGLFLPGHTRLCQSYLDRN